MSTTRSWVRAVALALCWLGASGCGYSTRLVLHDAGDSVGVELFGNSSLERDVERELHVEMTRAVRNLIDLPLRSPERADLVLRGKILQYHRRGGIRSPQNRLLETGLRIVVSASLVDRASGERLSGPLEIPTEVGYSLAGVGSEAAARTRALRNLAERIALDLFATSEIPSIPTDPEPERIGGE